MIWKRKVKKNISTIDVNDLLEVLEHTNFSNQKKIELLEIINYTLCVKHCPEDICSIIDRKIQLLKQEEQAAKSNLQLSTKKGFKVNFIRVINCLCELSFFTDRKGNDITKKEVFDTFGRAINQDLSTFHSDLSATKSAANSDMKNTLAIFEQLHAKQQEINNK